ncbi:MAG: AmmeMemoRadiSam system protein B [Candidatus Kerfeldbacteria bacterium]
MQRRAVAWSIGVLAVATGIVGGTLWIRGFQTDRNASAAIIPVQDTSSWAVNDAFVRAIPYTVQPKGRVVAGIVPHHTLVAPLIAAFFRGLEASYKPETVVIVGPDHENKGTAYVTTAKNSWGTPDGVVSANQEMIQALVDRGVAVYDDALIIHEPSVSAAIPYLAHQFPNASIVPLAIRGDLRSDKLDQLADAISDLIGPNDLLIASVDFSHYKDIEGARTDDERSLSVLTAGDADTALDIPVDSPPSISLLLRFAKKRGLTYQQLVHTNSAEFLNDPTITSTTSYLTAYFY